MRLTRQQLETHPWCVASVVRGKTAGRDDKNDILSLMFDKRLSDSLANEADGAVDLAAQVSTGRMR